VPKPITRLLLHAGRRITKAGGASSTHRAHRLLGRADRVLRKAGRKIEKAARPRRHKPAKVSAACAGQLRALVDDMRRVVEAGRG
jgi:hypothetical protein